MFGVIAGEVLYNLRAALDYLVYALCTKDAGSGHDGTQFPIEDSPDGFSGNVARFLNGLNAAHVALIERLQPYNGCDWTRRLRDLSVPDQHGHIQALTTQVSLVSPFGVEPADVSAPSDEVDMEVKLALSVAFRDGTRVIETLEQIKHHVASTLEQFKSEF